MLIMFNGPSPITEPIARTIARNILCRVNEEEQRRIAIQQSIFRDTWNNPDATAAEIFAEIGPEGEKFMEVGTASVQHIAAIAAINGKTLNEVLDPSDYSPPPHTIHEDGTVTINP